MNKKNVSPTPTPAPKAIPATPATCTCGKTMEPGAAVCNDCLEDSTFVIPAVCKGCGKKDYKELLDFCVVCETNGTGDRLRGGDEIDQDCDGAWQYYGPDEWNEFK